MFDKEASQWYVNTVRRAEQAALGHTKLLKKIIKREGSLLYNPAFNPGKKCAKAQARD